MSIEFYYNHTKYHYKQLFTKLLNTNHFLIYPIYNNIPFFYKKNKDKENIYCFNKIIKNNDNFFNLLTNNNLIPNSLYLYDNLNIININTINSTKISLSKYEELKHYLKLYIDKYDILKKNQESKLYSLLNKISIQIKNIITDNLTNDLNSKFFLIKINNNTNILYPYSKNFDINDPIIEQIDKDIFYSTNILSNKKYLLQIDKSIKIIYNNNISEKTNQYTYYKVILDTFISTNIPENKLLDKEIKAIYLKRIINQYKSYIQNNYNDEIKSYIKWILKTQQINITELTIINLIYKIIKYKKIIEI